jgi:hypothetical protein
VRDEESAEGLAGSRGAFPADRSSSNDAKSSLDGRVHACNLAVVVVFVQCTWVRLSVRACVLIMWKRTPNFLIGDVGLFCSCDGSLLRRRLRSPFNRRGSFLLAS